MNINNYFDEIKKNIAALRIAVSYQVLIEHRTTEYGKIKVRVDFLDNSSLYFMEFVKSGRVIEKYKFSYHYQDKKGKMIFRYDNSRHYSGLSSFPCHKHIGLQDKVVEFRNPKLPDILEEISKWIQKN